MQQSSWDFLKRKGTAVMIPETEGCKRLSGVKVVDDRDTGSSRKAHTREAGYLCHPLIPQICPGQLLSDRHCAGPWEIRPGTGSPSPCPHKVASLAGRQLVVLTEVWMEGSNKRLSSPIFPFYKWGILPWDIGFAEIIVSTETDTQIFWFLL